MVKGQSVKNQSVKNLFFQFFWNEAISRRRRPLGRGSLGARYCSQTFACLSLQYCLSLHVVKTTLASLEWRFANCDSANCKSANRDLTADNMKMLKFWQIVSRQIVIGKLNTNLSFRHFFWHKCFRQTAQIPKVPCYKCKEC